MVEFIHEQLFRKSPKSRMKFDHGPDVLLKKERKKHALLAGLGHELFSLQVSA